jgi:hypothetical protein
MAAMGPFVQKSGLVMRDEQRARNEALFRSLNERLKELDDRLDMRAVGAPAIDHEEFFCECGRLDCMARVAMTRAEYESIRAYGERFAALEEHVDESIEDVIERHRGFVVVQKEPGEPAEIARELDPRS